MMLTQRRRGVCRGGALQRQRTGPPPAPEDPHDYFLQWMDSARGGPEAAAPGKPNCHYFDFENTYWAHRAEPNLLFVHYADMKADLAGEIRRISDFLAVDTPDALLPSRRRSPRSFETMKAQGEAMLPELAVAFEGGSQRFIHKGTNGRWRDVLTPTDLARYDALVARKLSPTVAAYLANGRLATDDPRRLPD